MNLNIKWVMAAHIHDDVGLVEPHAVHAASVGWTRKISEPTGNTTS